MSISKDVAKISGQQAQKGKNSRQGNSMCKELVSGRSRASCRQGERDEWSIVSSDWREVFAVRPRGTM